MDEERIAAAVLRDVDSSPALMFPAVSFVPTQPFIDALNGTAAVGKRGSAR